MPAKPPACRVATFGELLMRLAAPDHLRLDQAGALEVTFAGAEANVAVALASLGVPSRFITRLPENPLADAALRALRGFGVHTGCVERGGSRIGIYFVEPGVAQRASEVVYDREGSGFSQIAPDSIAWRDALSECTWFHTSGISPAVSASAAAVTKEAVTWARDIGLRISLDLNYRAKLWQWGGSTQDVMGELVSRSHVVFSNETDLQSVFGITVPEPTSGNALIDPHAYEASCHELMDRFPSVEMVALTLRGALSASENTWTAVLATRTELYTTRRYSIAPIIDRVGSGDAFAGAAIACLTTRPDAVQHALDFAVAASCLKHSILGDFNRVTIDEVERLASGDGTGRIVR